MKNKCVEQLVQLLGKEKVLIGESLSNRYTHIWRMDIPLQAVALILPSSTKEVSEALKICYLNDQKISIHGGLTNLVGSTETQAQELVISLEKMNKIIEVDTASRTITVEAGTILQHVHEAASTEGLLFPLSYGAKGSAQIGGMIASNAGGLRVLRFGMTRQLVLGLEAVLADGTIISSMKKIIKDNSAYDLKQLFIGSEGTLGIITKAVLKLVEAPKSRCSAFVAFNDYAKVVFFLKYMDQGLAGLLSGYELIWQNTYACMTSPSHVKQPLPLAYKYYVLLESLGSDQAQDQNKLESLLASALEEDLILDAVPAQTQSDLHWFWSIREDVHVIKSACDIDQHFDISLPIKNIGDYVDQVIPKLKSIVGVNQIYTFGHVADGNIHFIVDKHNNSDEVRKAINHTVYEPLQALGGSVSAEHGIGVDKRDYLALCRTSEEIALMRLLKQSLDSKNILNPRNIFLEP